MDENLSKLLELVKPRKRRTAAIRQAYGESAEFRATVDKELKSIEHNRNWAKQFAERTPTAQRAYAVSESLLDKRFARRVLLHLRAKGVYADSYTQMIDLCTTTYGVHNKLYQLLTILCSIPLKRRDPSSLDMNAWMYAICLARFNYGKDVTKDNMAEFVEAEYNHMLVNAYMLMQFGGDALREDSDLVTSLRKEIESLNQELSAINRRRTVSQSRQAELDGLRKANKGLMKKLEVAETPYKAELMAKDAEIARLRMKVDLLQASLGRSPIAADIPVEELLTLPESGVVFVGGHTKLVQRLRVKYPDWTFYSGVKHSTYITHAAVTFMYTDYMKHAVYYAYREHGPNAPILYISGVNLDILEEDMRRQYTQLRRSQDENTP